MSPSNSCPCEFVYALHPSRSLIRVACCAAVMGPSYVQSSEADVYETDIGMGSQMISTDFACLLYGCYLVQLSENMYSDVW